MTPDFGVRVARDGDTVRLEISGEIDLATAERAQAAVDDALEPTPSTLTVSLAEVSFIDSHGIWLIVECHRRALRGGFRLVIDAGASPVRRALALAGLEELLTSSEQPNGAGPVRLTLFISSEAGSGARAVAAGHELVRRVGEDRARLEVVDVLREPARAEEAKVIATPTLVRMHPPPQAKLIGEIDGVETLARRLGLDLAGKDAPPGS